jgi:hypothetical protein
MFTILSFPNIVILSARNGEIYYMKLMWYCFYTKTVIDKSKIE